MPENQKGRAGQTEGGRTQNNSSRGLASADKETRQRVASAGGKASHGGGRKKDSSKER